MFGNRIVALGLAAAAALFSEASAASVSVIGGFTSFSTGFVYAATGPTAVNQVNGEILCSTSGCDSDGPASLTFTPRASVSFEVIQRGVGRLTPNGVSFSNVEPQTVNAVGDPFLIGQLRFINGIWTDTVARLGLTLTTISDDPLFDGKVLTDILFMQATPELGGTPETRADFVYLQNHPELGSLRAYERGDSLSNFVVVDVYAKIGSLVPVAFANPQGGFIDAGVDIAPTVPVPSAAFFMFSGIAMFVSNRLQRNANSRRWEQPSSLH